MTEFEYDTEMDRGQWMKSMEVVTFDIRTGDKETFEFEFPAELEYIIDSLVDAGFFAYPASINHHGNTLGGLARHSIAVMERLVDMEIDWQRPESPYIVGLLHDIVKLAEYEWDEDMETWIKVDLPDTHHHGKVSTYIVNLLTRLTEEERLCIRYHMGAYVVDDWDGFDKAIRKYESVLYTHFVDMVVSKLDGL